jgi:hypothetical protein
MAPVVAVTACGHDVRSDRAPAIHLRGQVLSSQPKHSRLVTRDAMFGGERFRALAPHRVPAVEAKVALGRESVLAKRAEIRSVRHRVSR